jgi:hypothetical protein
LIANTFEDLFSGTLLAPLDVDQLGNKSMFNVSVWTGTLPDGTAVPDAGHCDDWTTSSVMKFSGYVGYSSVSDERWTMGTDPETPEPCIGTNHLYCFEGK